MMIETVILDYLTAALAPSPVFPETPEDVPGTYVLIQKTGSARADHITRSTFALQSIAPTLLEAAELNERVKAAADAMGPGDGVFAAKLSSDYEFTNLRTKQYRYQAVYDFYH